MSRPEPGNGDRHVTGTDCPAESSLVGQSQLTRKWPTGNSRTRAHLGGGGVTAKCGVEENWRAAAGPRRRRGPPAGPGRRRRCRPQAAECAQRALPLARLASLPPWPAFPPHTHFQTTRAQRNVRWIALQRNRQSRLLDHRFY
jgi:hypothetical protein